MNSLAYIRAWYNVPAKRGARVRVNGRPGTITGASGARLRIRLDGETNPRPYHPKDGIEYAEEAKPQ